MRFFTFVVLMLLCFCSLATMKVQAADVKVSIRPYKHAPFIVKGEPYKSNVALLTPSALNKKAEAINVVVVFHGFSATIGQFVETCKPGFAAAYEDSTNTVMIAPQLAYNAKSRAASKLEEENGLHDLIYEVFKKNKIHSKIGAITIVAYSGGYWAATQCLNQNPGLNIQKTVFLDTLYFMADLAMLWFDDTKTLIVFCSNEKESLAAKEYVINAARYTEASFVEVGDEYFFTTDMLPQYHFVIVDTAWQHEEVFESLFGSTLKKLQEMR